LDPVTLGLLVNAGGLLAKKFMGADRPEYEIPESARRALSQARILQADKNMPGEQKALEQIGISSANATRAAAEGGNVLEAISSIQGQQDRATQGVLARSEADQRNDQERLMQQLGIMSQYEDQKYQMNEFAPYAENQQETRDIIGAMGQNAANLLLSKQTKAAIGDNATPGFLSSDWPTYDPAMAAEPEQVRIATPSLLPQTTSKVVSDGGKLATLPFSVTTNAESEATDYDRIRRLLGMLQKSPSAYPY